jgi:hypothetical protein
MRWFTVKEPAEFARQVEEHPQLPPAGCERLAGYGVMGRGRTTGYQNYEVSVNVVFLGGADFDSPPPLGTTDRTQYIKVTTLEEAQRPELHKWIEEASRTPGWT